MLWWERLKRGQLPERIPDTEPLRSLFHACGNAANRVEDPEIRAALGDRMMTMLQHMVDDDYLPHPDTIERLHGDPLYAVFQTRKDYRRLVNILRERNPSQDAPAFVRSLPEPVQPAARWLSRRTYADFSSLLTDWFWLRDRPGNDK